MQKLTLTVLSLLITLSGFSQVASRLLSTQSAPRPLSAPNIMWVDITPGAQERIWVANVDSFKMKPINMMWLKDSTISFTANLYRAYNWVPTWSDVDSKPTFSTVATTGQYNDLIGKPTLFSGSYLDLTNVPSIFPSNIANVSGLTSALNGKISVGATISASTISGLAPVATTGSYNDLVNKPTLFSGSYVDLTNKPTVFPTDISNVSGLTTALANKISVGANIPASTITGLATVTTTGSYNDLTNKPTVFPTDISNVSGLTTALNNKITVGDPIPYSTLTGVPTIPAAQVQSDWNQTNNTSVDYIKNKPTIPTNNNQLTNGSNYITSAGAPVQSVNGQTGAVILSIPAAQIQSDWNQSTISAVDYIKNKPTIPTNTNQLTNGAGFITGITGAQVNVALGYTPYNSTNPNGYISGITSSQVTTALGYTPYNSTNPNGYISGITSGQVTTALGFTPYNSTNPGNYITRTGISAGTGISYDNSTGVITNSAPDQTVSLTAGTGISVTGTYPSFTVSSTVAAPTINNNVARTLNSNYTISSTRIATVYYSVSISVTNPLLVGTSTGTAFLEYSTNGGSSWNTVSQISNSSGVGITVTISLQTGGAMILSGIIPANALTRIRTTTSGTATVTYVIGQEVLN